MLHVLSSLSNKNHTNPLSLTSLSQLNLLAMGLRPLSNRDTIQPWMGHWPSSTPTLESERRSRVEGRGIDPESCDYDLGCDHYPHHPKFCIPCTSTNWVTGCYPADASNIPIDSTQNRLCLMLLLLLLHHCSLSLAHEKPEEEKTLYTKNYRGNIFY